MSLLLLLGGSGGGAGGGPDPEDGVTLSSLDNVQVVFEVSESAPFAATQTWHDFTPYIHGRANLQLDRGRSSEFDEVQAGTLTLTLRDSSGDLDPRNASSSLADCLKPRRQCRLRVVWDETTYTLFRGFCHGFPRSVSRPSIQTFIPFKASDAFRILGTVEPTAGLFTLDDSQLGVLDANRLGGETVADQYSGELIDALADSLGYPSDLRDIDTGIVFVEGDEVDGRAAQVMTAAAKTEGGDLYISADGKITFRDRFARFTETRSTTAQATFNPSRTSPPFYTEPLRIEFDDTRFINDVRYTGASGVQFVERDETSIDAYGVAGEEETLIAVHDSDVKALAQYRVSQASEPEDRVEELVVPVHANTASHFPAVLGRELFDRIDVVVGATYDSSTETFATVIQGITHTITKDSWLTTFKLGPYVALDLFTLDDDTLGELDGVAVLA